MKIILSAKREGRDLSLTVIDDKEGFEALQTARAKVGFESFVGSITHEPITSVKESSVVLIQLGGGLKYDKVSLCEHKLT